MSKKLILCFDGTWNTPDDNGDIDGDESTNVYKFCEAIETTDSQGNNQYTKYDQGVGTKWYDKIKGGVFGVGLSANIQEGYAYLVENYKEGDLIYLLGFSRGAYTARSLVGLIRNSGILSPPHMEMLNEAYDLYRTRDDGADSENAKYFREQFSREAKIHFLGVWDTVGALGIPTQSFGWFNKRYYEFHDTELSGIVQHAYHALAIDEHRRSFTATLWDPKQKPNQVMEQRWFPGAYANVGGGYSDHYLSDIALAWMIDKAQECGLAIVHQKKPALTDENYKAPITDSYKAFLRGAYSRFAERHYRDIGTTVFGNEAIDVSTQQRCLLDPNYRPKNPLGDRLIGDFRPTQGRIAVAQQ